MSLRFVPIAASYIPSFHAAVDTVARERRYLATSVGPSLEQCATFVHALLAGGGVQFFAVSEADEVVGWCDIVRQKLEGFQHVGRLGMGLLPAYRGAGNGRRLAEDTIRTALQSGIERIELEVFASNCAALRLYERLGFQREGVKQRARKLDGIYDDIVLMAWMQPSSELRSKE